MSLAVPEKVTAFMYSLASQYFQSQPRRIIPDRLSAPLLFIVVNADCRIPKSPQIPGLPPLSLLLYLAVETTPTTVLRPPLSSPSALILHLAFAIQQLIIFANISRTLQPTQFPILLAWIWRRINNLIFTRIRVSEMACSRRLTKESLKDEEKAAMLEK